MNYFMPSVDAQWQFFSTHILPSHQEKMEPGETSMDIVIQSIALYKADH